MSLTNRLTYTGLTNSNVLNIHRDDLTIDGLQDDNATLIGHNTDGRISSVQIGTGLTYNNDHQLGVDLSPFNTGELDEGSNKYLNSLTINDNNNNLSFNSGTSTLSVTNYAEFKTITLNNGAGCIEIDNTHYKQEGQTLNRFMMFENGLSRAVQFGDNFAYDDGTRRLSLDNLTGFTTSDLTEGDNKYYSNTLVDNHLSGSTGISYATGAISIDFTEFSSDDITQGTNNKYLDALQVSDNNNNLSYNSSTDTLSFKGSPTFSAVLCNAFNPDSAGDSIIFQCRDVSSGLFNVLELKNDGIYYPQLSEGIYYVNGSHKLVPLSVSNGLAYSGGDLSISNLSSFSSDELDEGKDNLYYTTTRLNNSLAAYGSNIIPDVTELRDLGSLAYAWDTIYANNVFLSGKSSTIQLDSIGTPWNASIKWSENSVNKFLQLYEGNSLDLMSYDGTTSYRSRFRMFQNDADIRFSGAGFDTDTIFEFVTSSGYDSYIDFYQDTTFRYRTGYNNTTNNYVISNSSTTNSFEFDAADATIICRHPTSLNQTRSGGIEFLEHDANYLNKRFGEYGSSGFTHFYEASENNFYLRACQHTNIYNKLKIARDASYFTFGDRSIRPCVFWMEDILGSKYQINTDGSRNLTFYQELSTSAEVYEPRVLIRGDVYDTGINLYAGSSNNTMTVYYIGSNFFYWVHDGSSDHMALYENYSGSTQKRMYITSTGQLFMDSTVTANGFDYSEYFESLDGTKLDYGRSVVIEPNTEKVRYYDETKDALVDIVGCVSPPELSAASGNNPPRWHDMYLRDDFGAYIPEEVKKYEWVEYIERKDEKGEVTSKEKKDRSIFEDDPEFKITTIPEGATEKIVTRNKINPDYDPNMDYTTRDLRPEWQNISLLGRVILRKGEPMGPRWKILKSYSEITNVVLIR